VPRIADQAALSGEPRLGALASSLSCYVAIREARHVDVELECGRGLAINRQIGDHRGVAVLTNVLGASRRRRGKLEEARAAFFEAWQVSQRLGDRTLSTRCSNNLANTDLDLGRYADAERGFREVVELRRVDGDERSRALALRGLANTLLDRGRLRDAEPPLIEAERALRAAKGRELPRILVTLAELRHAEGDRDGALALLDESVALDETGAEPDSAAYGRALRARFEIAWRPGRPAAVVCDRLSQSSQVLRRLGDRRLADVLAWEGSCWVRAGRLDLAAPVIDGGDTAAALSSAPVPRLELALARAELELARRRPEAALRLLDRAATESRTLDHVALLFEIRLLAARAESAQRASIDRLRTLLESLRDDAHAQRFETIARQASDLLAPLSAAGAPRGLSGSR
jgi:tetratricopeptide (TPR) repeat protein